jgi:hypothetical protein
MATTYLGLALPVQGSYDGQWGDLVNYGITDYVDIAVAGTTTLATDQDETLTITTGTNVSSGITGNSAQYAIIKWTASNGATTRNITAPASSKSYIVINAGTGSIVLRGAGPTTGVTIVSGEKCLAVWNGSDFIKVASTQPSGVLPAANGGTGVANNAASTITISGAYSFAMTLSGATSVTFPTSGTVATLAGATTLTNKRIDPRVYSVASTSTLSPDIAAYDQYNLTAQAAPVTIAAPIGTPADGNRSIFRFYDNGTARAITWNATYTAIGVTLPASTTVGKTIYVGCIYNAAAARWDVVAVATQA